MVLFIDEFEFLRIKYPLVLNSPELTIWVISWSTILSELGNLSLIIFEIPSNPKAPCFSNKPRVIQESRIYLSFTQSA